LIVRGVLESRAGRTVKIQPSMLPLNFVRNFFRISSSGSVTPSFHVRTSLMSPLFTAFMKVVAM
jgi:hypothetical protein